MPSKLLRTGLFAAALAVVPTALVAQEPAAPVATAPTELQQLQARIGGIQQRASQDPAVAAAAAEITAAMEAADPEYKALAARAITIRADVEAARAASDNARLNELAAEAQTLQASVNAARTRASAHADVQAKTTAYRTALLKKMVELEPDTQALLARLGELSRPQQ